MTFGLSSLKIQYRLYRKGKIRAEYRAWTSIRHMIWIGVPISKLELEKVDELIYTTDYGELAVGKVDRIEGSMTLPISELET